MKQGSLPRNARINTETHIRAFRVIRGNYLCSMKLFLIASITIFFAACNNQEKTSEKSKTETAADTLSRSIDTDHGVAMSKMSKISKAEQLVQQAIDSITKLTGKARQAAAPYKFQLDSALDRLKYSAYAMDRWMSEYNIDSALNDSEKRIEYLSKEKLKVSRVKTAILTTLNKVDSLLKQKF